MNERVMQFRIGMFVIVAGLVLTMLIVWFGESPALFQDRVYVIAHYEEAPGVSEGIPVRKSGIRVGEVSAIAFDDPSKPDGVLVTLSLDGKYKNKIKTGSVPRITRALIGDVAIDMLPGTGSGVMKTSPTPAGAPVIEGSVAPDPSKAMAAATTAFEKVGDTLASINQAADGIAKVTQSAEKLNDFLVTWNDTGKKLSTAAAGIDGFIKANQADFQPAVANLREVSQKLNSTLDVQTQAALKTGINHFSAASSRLDSSLTAADPFFKDLGAPVNVTPSTDFGQTLRRMNRITSDLNLLTRNFSDGKGGLNPDGSLQRLVTRVELYENLNRMAAAGSETLVGFKPIIASLRVFADRIAREPSSLVRRQQ